MNCLLNMGNMKKINFSEQYKLSEKYTIYKTTYDNTFSKDDFLKRINQNEALYYNETYKIQNSLDIHIECEEFKSVDKQALNFLRTKLSSTIDKFIKSSWIYVQIPSFKMEWIGIYGSLTNEITPIKTNKNLI